MLLIPASSHAAEEVVPTDVVVPNNVGMQLKTSDSATLDQVRELGVKWVRRGFYWNKIEVESGKYDFSEYDVFVKDCKDRGLSLVGCLFSQHPIHGHPKDPAGRKAFAAWAGALAAHFKGQGIYWEIWNEPNTMTFWGKHGKKGNSEPYAEEYTNLVKEVVPAIKKADPNCIILAGSVSNMWTESYNWMKYCFADGMLKVPFDAWSVHPYGLKSPEDYIEAYAITRDLMRDAGATKLPPLVNTERGFPISNKEGFAGGGKEKQLEYQAWNLVRQYLIDQLLGVQFTIWYEWGGKEGFGLYQPNTPTPAYQACEVMIKELSGYKLTKRLPTTKPRDFVLRFENGGGGTKLAVWTAPPPMQPVDKIEPHAISIPVEVSGSLETTDIFGKKGTVEVKSGKIEVELTGAPIYISLGK